MKEPLTDSMLDEQSMNPDFFDFDYRGRVYPTPQAIEEMEESE